MFKAMPWIWGSLVLALAASLPARSAEAEPQSRAYVVLVGIDTYADKQIKPRTHAEADAKALFDLLTDKAHRPAEGVEARLLLGQPDEKRQSEPATHDNIVKALHWAASKAGRDDLVVFGYFGQGAPQGERACYFASDSTFKDRGKNALSAAVIEHELKGLKSQHFVAFLDVNFKGFDAGKDTAPEMNMQNFYKEFLGKDDDEPQGGRILFLANSGLKPTVELKNHGLFTQALLDGLKGAADKDGYEPDGLVTVDELIEYLDKEVHAQALKYGKTKEEKEQNYLYLGGRSVQFVLSHNPVALAKVKERLDKLAQLAKDKGLKPDLLDEGQRLLGQMPKLEAYRNLRKDYQKLADGTITVEDFTKSRKKQLDALKYKRADALEFAAKVIQATQQIRDNYVKEINQGEMVGWAIRGVYQRIDEKIPQDIKERLDKIKGLKEADLTALLADVRERLGKREDLDNHKDIDHALQRMLTHLDPYTTYIDPETLDRFRQETSATFTGIGIQIRPDTTRDMLKVITPIKGSPAYKAGLKAGDVITKIVREMDSQGKPLDPPEVISTKGLPISEAVKKILGKAGTKVKVVVERPGVAKPMEFEITRALIEVETVMGVKRRGDDSWDFIVDPESKIAYIRLASFAQYTARDLANALIKLEKKGVKGLVLDLRFNPGGLLSSAVAISDMFIDDGLIVSIRPRVGREFVYNGEHDASLTKFPMACLVNGGSASGSEIVAACLQDHKRAVIIGERSYGKGSVQNIQNFEGGQLKMTTASYWRPSGKNINKSSTGGKDEDEWGVSPDRGFTIKLTPKERQELADYQRDTEVIRRPDAPPDEEDKKPEFKDRQLEKALEYLRGQIKVTAQESARKAG